MQNTNPETFSRYAWLSIATAVTTIVLKTVAYFITGSVGLLSDAAESVVNLIGAVMTLAMLTIAARPADRGHPYGHGKAEYFSSGLEGTLIFIAAILIAYAAIKRLVHPAVLVNLGPGIVVSVVATLINALTSSVLIIAGKRHKSIALEADGYHLLTDVWTSIGVIVGVGLVMLTGWNLLDPIVALLVSLNITVTAIKILQRSVQGLMDSAIPLDEQTVLAAILEPYRQAGLNYHSLRTSQSGINRLVTLHILLPGSWTVEQGHKVVEQIEKEICEALPHTTVVTHMESLDDPNVCIDALR